jgi:hypothetical protein
MSLLTRDDAAFGVDGTADAARELELELEAARTGDEDGILMLVMAMMAVEEERGNLVFLGDVWTAPKFRDE